MIHILLSLFLAWLFAACAVPGRAPRGDRLPSNIEKILENEEGRKEKALNDEEVSEDAGIPFGEEIEDTAYLRASTWNVNRYNERKARRVGRPTLQPHDKAAATLSELMTHWIKANEIDILAMQEILDLPPLIGGNTDPDFPDLKGYTLLPGFKIKGWFNNRVMEHCPIYYRTGQIKSCATERMVNLAKTDMHWAKCETSKGKEFWFGCAHPAYGDVVSEIRFLRDSIAAWQRAAGASGGRVEYVLGMDANSYHNRRAR